VGTPALTTAQFESSVHPHIKLKSGRRTVSPSARVRWFRVFSSALGAFVAADGAAQPTSPSTERTRAESLYVSVNPEDLPRGDHEANLRRKAATDSAYHALSRGRMDFRKVSYRSPVGDLDVPAYLFQPLTRNPGNRYAAMIWVHGGVHGDWPLSMFPFVLEAISRHYVIIAPEYRGSTGYGEKYYRAIDYGGHELEDVIGAVEYLKTLPHVDPERIGILGWSHGGFIASHLLFSERTPFRAGGAIVPVTNLVFRLSIKGPSYQRDFAPQARLAGLPFEQPDRYLERSPVYHVDKLAVPMLVHVATNDPDVLFAESEQMVNVLRVKKPGLADVRVYVDPPGSHAFDRVIDGESLKPLWTPEQRDSWNRVWTFFEWYLRPYSCVPCVAHVGR
jgi:dipeptidyl aminopeptidase/acylaminoacyl peptidase